MDLDKTNQTTSYQTDNKPMPKDYPCKEENSGIQIVYFFSFMSSYYTHMTLLIAINEMPI